MLVYLIVLISVYLFSRILSLGLMLGKALTKSPLKDDVSCVSVITSIIFLGAEIVALVFACHLL